MFIRRTTHEALLKDITQEARAMGALAAKYKRERNDAEVALTIARAEAAANAEDARKYRRSVANLKQNRAKQDAGTF
jgi:hypothetical protein